MLPSLQFLQQISQRIKTIPNQRGESKQKIHYCCYLLGLKSGLRVSEAVGFDLNAKSKKDLYSVKSKGQKNRYVFIPRKVISELKKHNWKPNHTNRFNFYHFLRKIKRELAIPNYVELTPHTLRRAFATYHAEAGLPLPLLQKLLGHKSVRTTALYWMNIYGGDDGGADSILITKNWLEKPKKPKPIPENPIQISLEQLPELIILNPLTSEPPNYSNKIKDLEHELSQISRENNYLKTELTREREQNTNLQQDLSNLGEQNAILCQQKACEAKQRKQIQQDLAEAKQIINQLKQKLTTAETDLAQVKQININLSQQLQTERENNTNLSQKLTQQEQNNTNLLNTYQKAIKDKQKTEILAQQEKTRADYYEQQLKSIAKTLYQWQKLNHYQKLEQQQKCQIIQPPPWKYK